MGVFRATPFWCSQGGGNVVTVEKYVFPNGWGVVVIARVDEGIIAMGGDVAITEPGDLFPGDNAERTNVESARARTLIELPEGAAFDEHGFAEWRSVEQLREFMRRVAEWPPHRLVGT